MLLTGILRESIRFGFSPLQEAVHALKVFVEPRPHAEQMTWLRHARRRASPAVKKAAKRFKCLLVPAPETFPSLLPSREALTFARELALLSRRKRNFRAAMVRRFIGKPVLTRAEITAAVRARALERLLRETEARDCDEVLAGFCDLLDAFFEQCLASQWEHFESVALGDARAREQLLQRFGVTRALRTLTRDLVANGDARTATLEFGGKESKGMRVALTPKGTLLLTPSYFIWPRATFRVLRTETVDVRVAYPIASPALAGHRIHRRQEAAKRFAAFSDATRLHMLELLANRRLSTREFAGMLGISEAGASRHLSILRSAGLVSAERDSYFVLYERTPLATSMLTLALLQFE